MYRVSQGIQQMDLASRLGIQQASLSRIEGGKHDSRIYNIYLIAQELGVTLNDLTEERPKKRTNDKNPSKYDHNVGLDSWILQDSCYGPSF